MKYWDSVSMACRIMVFIQVHLFGPENCLFMHNIFTLTMGCVKNTYCNHNHNHAIFTFSTQTVYALQEHCATLLCSFSTVTSQGIVNHIFKV